MYHEKLESLIAVVKVIRSKIDELLRQIDGADESQNCAAIRVRRAASRAGNGEEIRGVAGNVSSTVGLIKVRVSREVERNRREPAEGD